jgi:hypothetical protein
MRRVLVPLIWLLLIVLHAPTQAQAVVFSLFPDFLALNGSQPAVLFVTGVSLILLANFGPARRR